MTDYLLINFSWRLFVEFRGLASPTRYRQASYLVCDKRVICGWSGSDRLKLVIILNQQLVPTYNRNTSPAIRGLSIFIGSSNIGNNASISLLITRNPYFRVVVNSLTFGDPP